jgi:SAM-dependent methyltransferase
MSRTEAGVDSSPVEERESHRPKLEFSIPLGFVGPARPQLMDKKSMLDLREFLSTVSYTGAMINRRLNITDHLQNRTERIGNRLKKLAEARSDKRPQDVLDVLIALLVLNNPVDKPIVEKFLKAKQISALEAMRLLVVDQDQVFADLTLTEWGGLYFVSDTIWRPQRASRDAQIESGPYEPVLNPLIGDSFTFASSVVSRSGRRCLDLCTGCGIVALHASRFNEAVVGVDISPRSIAFAEFNQSLNGVSNVEFFQADLYEGISGKFDTIAANPPYLPCLDSHPGENFYCGGASGDTLTTAILEGLDQRLDNLGYCHLVGFFIYQQIQGETGFGVSPDLTKFQQKGYDILTFTYEVPFRDTRCVSSTADFGDATKVEYGPYVLRRRVGSSSNTWFVQAPFIGGMEFAVDALFAQLDGSPELPSMMAKSNSRTT